MFLIRITFFWLISIRALGFPSDYWDYIEQTSHFFGVGDCVIAGILRQEGGTAGHYTEHSNGAVDIGLAQINKGGAWMRRFVDEYGFTEEQIRDNPYLSILLVGYIVYQERRATGDVLEAISAYHTGFGSRRSPRGVRYAEGVLSHAKDLARNRMCFNI